MNYLLPNDGKFLLSNAGACFGWLAEAQEFSRVVELLRADAKEGVDDEDWFVDYI